MIHIVVKIRNLNVVKQFANFGIIMQKNFRVLDAKSYEKLHRVLVMYLCKCLLYLIGELMQFDGELVLSFCLATLAEYGQSSMKDQLPKVKYWMLSPFALIKVPIDFLFILFLPLHFR